MLRSRTGALGRGLGFTALFVLAVYVGRESRSGAELVALVWPAAGVAVWWLSSARSRVELVVSACVLAVATSTVNLLTGVGPTMSALFGPINAVHGLVGALVLQRLLPGLDGLRTPGDVHRVLLAAAAATVVSAPLSTLTVWAGAGADPFVALPLFGLRNASATFIVLATVLALREQGLRETLTSHPAELVVGTVPATGVFVGIFALPNELPVLFLAMLVPVWLGTRLGVGPTALVGGALCSFTVVLTLTDLGALAGVADTVTRALLVQAFVVVLTLVGLSLATLQRRNDEVTRRLEASRRQLQQVADAAVIGKAVVVRGTDGAWRLTRPNPSLVRLLARDPSGMRWHDLLLPSDALLVHAAVDRLVDEPDEAWEGEVRHRLPGGNEVWTQLHVQRIPTEDGTAAVVAQVLDITERRAAQEELSRLALHDPLTGLPNRAQLHTRLDDMLAGPAHAGRTTDPRPSVLVAFVDLDGFKQVNDSYGHDVGDEVLRAVADRLRAALRPEDLVGRLGGDEFVACAPGVDAPREAEVLVHRLTATLAPALLVRGRDVGLGVSVGWTLSRPDDSSATVLRRSDEAMYAAKRAGKGRVVGDPPASGTGPPAAHPVVPAPR